MNEKLIKESLERFSNSVNAEIERLSRKIKTRRQSWSVKK